MALSDETSGGGIPAVMNVAPTGGGYGYPAMGYPVMPMMGGGYGGFGNGLFGGDGSWLLLLILLCSGGWGGLGGFGGFGGLGNMALGYDFPWLLNGQQGINNNVSDGFRDAQLHDSVTSVRDGVSNLATQLCDCCGNIQMGIANTGAALTNALNSGFGDVQLGIAGLNQNVSTTGAGIQQSLCNGFAGVNQNVSNIGAGINLGMANGFAGVNSAIANTAAQGEVAANSRHSALTGQLYNNEIANLNRSFAEQTANVQGFNGVQGQLAQGFCDNRAGLADLKYTVATENCQDRYEAANNTRNIIESQTRGTQAILDKLCALELDSVKGQLAAAQRENVGLQNQLNMANLAASQAAQTATFQQGMNNEVDALYNRLKNCPVPCTPVYGNTPIFTCNGGCGGNGLVA